MCKLTSYILVCIFIVYIKVGYGRYHNCKRVGQACENGGVCNSNGTCSCVAGYMGIKCELQPSFSYSEFCNPPCQNSGVCLMNRETNEKTCMCTDDRYYGSLCEKARVSTKCEGETMHITVVPYPSFSGLVLIPQNRSHSVCDFNRTMNGNEAVHTLSVNVTSNDCSVNELTNTPSENGKLTYGVRVLIQNSPTFETHLDIILQANCVYSTNGISSVKNNVDVFIDDDRRSNVTKDSVTVEYQPISLRLQSVSGGPIPTPLVLGTPLQLRISLVDETKYNNLVVLQCEAFSVGGVREERATLIEQGCVTDIGRKVVNNEVVYDNIFPFATINFLTFRFSQTPQVEFGCNVRACLPTEVCSRPTCGNRLKRDAERNNVDVHSLAGNDAYSWRKDMISITV